MVLIWYYSDNQSCLITGNLIWKITFRKVEFVEIHIFEMGK